MEALLIRLQGPMASWGSLVVGNNRKIASAPTQSALLELLGACCGIDRRDSDALNQWFDLWHTVTLHLTRRQGDRHPQRFCDVRTAHDSLKLGGVLDRDHRISDRDRGYQQEAFAIAAFILKERADPRLLAIARSGLQQPVYTPYLGRLSNPFTADPYLKQGHYTSIEALLEEMKLLLQSEQPVLNGEKVRLTEAKYSVSQALIH